MVGVGLSLALAACGAATGSDSHLPTAEPTSAPSPAPSIDPGAALAEALDRLAGAYAFESTLTVGEDVATTAIGRWVGGASETEVSSGAAMVTYRSIPPRAWVREGDDADWAELEGEVPNAPPLDALRAPSDLVVIDVGTTATTLQARYPAATLGQPGDAPIPVTLVLGADGTVEADYTVAVGGNDAVARSLMSPLVDAAPIEAPPA
jgi:hypothetical protein